MVSGSGLNPRSLLWTCFSSRYIGCGLCVLMGGVPFENCFMGLFSCYSFYVIDSSGSNAQLGARN